MKKISAPKTITPEDFAKSISGILDRLTRRFENGFEHSGWKEAWKPTPKPEGEEDNDGFRPRRRSMYRDIFEDRPEKLSAEDQAALSLFIAKNLLATDPTPEKRYTPLFLRLFNTGRLSYGELGELSALLKKHADGVANGIVFKADPFSRPSGVSQKRSWQNRHAGSNPLKMTSVWDVEKYFTIAEKRSKFARDVAARQSRDQKFIASGQALLVANTPDFRLYTTQSKEAHDAYNCNGRDRWGPDIAYLELPNGARYTLSVSSRSAQNEDGQNMLYAKMMRDIPGLAQAIAPLIVQYIQNEPRISDNQAVKDKILWDFASQASGWDGISVLEDGDVARAFTSRYENLLAHYEELSKPEVREEGQPELPRQRDDRLKYRNQLMHDLYDDLTALARHTKERSKVNPTLIQRALAAALESGSEQMCQRVLAIAQTVPEWRTFFTATTIAPVFQKLSGWRFNRMYVGDVSIKGVCYMFTLVAKDKNWRDGTEAAYLPEALKHMIEKRDWKKLKTVLTCASQNTEVGALWRAAIPRETMAQLHSLHADNEFKHHYLDRIIMRINALESGDASRPIRLAKMPNTPEGISAYRREAARKQRQRRSHVLEPAAA